MKPTEPLAGDALQGVPVAHQADRPERAVPRIAATGTTRRTVEGKQYPIHCRKKGTLDAAEEVMLDVNELAKGEKFFSVGRARGERRRQPARVRHRHHRLPRIRRSRSRTCARASCSRRKFVKATNVEWAADNKTLFYVTEDAAKRPHKLWRHTLGEPKEKDVLVYEEKDELFRLGAGEVARREVPVPHVRQLDHAPSSGICRPTQPTGEWKTILPREDDTSTRPTTATASSTSARTRKATNFKVVTCPVDEDRPGELEGLRAVRPEGVS